MNYRNLITRRQSNYMLNRENAIINNISKGKIFEAELMAKKDLVPKESSLMQAYREKQAEASPLYKISQKQSEQLKAIAEKPTLDYRRLSNAFMQAIRDVDDGQEAIEGDSPRVDLPVEEIFEEPTSPSEQPTAWHRVGDRVFMQVDPKSKANLDSMSLDDVDMFVTKYKDELTKFISHMTNTRVTDAMKQHNTFDRHNNALQNSLSYGHFLDKYLQYREARQQGSSIMTNVADLVERFKVLYGEIKSGNKNTKLINEFRDIIYYLYKNRLLSKDVYSTMMLMEI